LPDERDFLSDDLICFGKELFCAPTENPNDRKLVVGELGIVSLESSLKRALPVTRGANANVDLRQLVVQVQNLDNIASGTRCFEHVSNRRGGSIHPPKVNVGLGELVLRRQLRALFEPDLDAA
jgi:hypothetical protein